MGIATKLFVLSIVFAGLAFWLRDYVSRYPEKIDYPTTGYFGPGKPKKDDETIRPFSINVSDAQILDLKQRLQQTRLTHDDLEDVPDFEFGFRRDVLEAHANYWLNSFDWRKAEASLNKFHHFKTQIEGIHLHFIRESPPAGKYNKVVPLLLAHGWPGTVFEFSKLIPLLVDPKKHGIRSEWAFEVVVPSIPGYGWSSPAHKKGMNVVVVARLYHKLMQRLRLRNYVAQGGDWGSAIVQNLARLYPDQLSGLHLNMFRPTRLDSWLPAFVANVAPGLVLEEEGFIKEFNLVKLFKEFIRISGYFHLHATTPDTLAGMDDSPIASLAWLAEKFHLGVDPAYSRTADGSAVRQRISMDEILTFVSIFWFQGNMVTAARLYKENLNDPRVLQLSKQFISVPTAYAALENDVIPAVPPAVIRTAVNLTQYSYLKGVGHFVAFEAPQLLANDLFEFVKKLTA